MTETQTASLTDFLLARIADRESDVQRRQTYAVGHTDRCIFEGGYEGSGACDCGAVDRVLAECEAKRQIVELHGPYRMASLDYCSSCGDVPQVEYPCPTLRALASVYADHPDYRAEWAL